MKFILILIFFILSNLSFSSLISDYFLFKEGIEDYDTKNFNRALKSFEILEEKYPNSKLFESTYANFYIGKNHYELHNYKKAVSYLLKVHYKNFNYETQYLIGKSYLHFNKEKAISYFLKLYQPKYNYSRKKYEELALIELSKFDKKYKYILEGRYQNNFDNLDKLKYSDLLKMGNFLFSLGKYKKAISIYESCLKINNQQILKEQILKSHLYNKDYDLVIKKGLDFLKNNPYKSNIYYYIGNGYRRKGEYKTAIKYLKKVKNDKLQNKVNFIIGKLYYVEKNYENAIFYLNASGWLDAKEYIIASYKKTNDKKNEKSEIIKLIQNKPYSDLAAQYRYELYLKENNNDYLKNIIKYNKDSYYYELALQKLNYTDTLDEINFNLKIKKYAHLIKKIELLSNIDFYEASLLEIEYTDFSKKDKLFKNYLKTMALEKNKKYNLALKQSYRYFWSYSQYKNLLPFLYPEYYKEYVEKYAKKYNVDKYLIYSVIKRESLFDTGGISGASAYGLMQLILPTARMFDKNITVEELLNPEKNIEIGTKYLSYLIKKYNNDLTIVIPSYNAGEGNVARWLNKYGQITANIIPYGETKRYYKKVFNNYYKYKRIYR